MLILVSRLISVERNELHCRAPEKTMQTFSANFCRCSTAQDLDWSALRQREHEQQTASVPLQRGVLAISGSQASDVELWSLQVELALQ